LTDPPLGAEKKLAAISQDHEGVQKMEPKRDAALEGQLLRYIREVNSARAKNGLAPLSRCREAEIRKYFLQFPEYLHYVNAVRTQSGQPPLAEWQEERLALRFLKRRWYDDKECTEGSAVK
jgi:hypothetical protein